MSTLIIDPFERMDGLQKAGIAFTISVYTTEAGDNAYMERPIFGWTKDWLAIGTQTDNRDALYIKRDKIAVIYIELT